MDNFLESLTHAETQEWCFLLASLPTYILGTVGTLGLIWAIIRRPRLWKPRHIFQALSLFNSLVGIFFGIYGFIFLAKRVGIISLPEGSVPNIFYFFIFHRYLLLSGDLIPSIDRCLAVVYPLKYYTHATVSMALGKCLNHFEPEGSFLIVLLRSAVCGATIILALGMTFLAWTVGVIPDFVVETAYPQFFLLTHYKFVLLLSFPYVVLAAAVIAADSRALWIALRRRKRLIKERGSFHSSCVTTSTSHGKSQDLINHAHEEKVRESSYHI